MRDITVGEHVRIMELTRRDRPLSGVSGIGATHDDQKLALYTVVAALGAWDAEKKIDGPGWSDPRPVTEENILALNAAVWRRLFHEYDQFFRDPTLFVAEHGAEY